MINIKGLSDEAQSQLTTYVDTLLEWQKVFNLTAITDPQKILTHHLLDSLSVLPYITDEPLLDVGSGAGFPGMVLAIAKPHLPVTLLDSAGKKARFLQQVKATLKLREVTVVNARAEAFVPPVLFPQITSRAFSDLTKFVELTSHCLAPGGRWLAMKGSIPHDEIQALPDSYVVSAIHTLQVPTTEERHLVVIQRRES